MESRIFVDAQEGFRMIARMHLRMGIKRPGE